jgi:hypothetical protein
MDLSSARRKEIITLTKLNNKKKRLKKENHA